LLSDSSTPDDHALFLEGDALREGDGKGEESVTGTCMVRFPRRVCTVVTSKMSGFCPESLILGIERGLYAGRIAGQGTRW
jgi:hypothetical protein